MGCARIGCDIGGTFTDVVLLDEISGEIYTAKVPSTPRDLAEGVVNGVKRVLYKSGVEGERVRFFVHGTTIPLNTLVERKGAKTGMLTTRGFRDVLEIGRASREHEYDLFQSRPEPIVPRHLRRTVGERIDYSGRVLMPLNEADVIREVRFLMDRGVEAIAVCYLHSYINPVHEDVTERIVKGISGEIFVSLSSKVNPMYKEYERFITTVINAYISPRTVRYLERLEASLRDLGIKCPILIIQSNGGVISINSAKQKVVNIIMAGPAAGTSLASHIGRKSRSEPVISLDMGGTTTLVSLLEGAAPRIVESIRIAGFPVRVPAVDVRAIGAGGGSIAKLIGKVIKVGPESAGAEPGPACYGKGGGEPTVTDANLVLGYLDADYFLGGEVKLDERAASRVIQEKIATPLGLSVDQAAYGVFSVVNASMAGAMRRITIEMGLDPRDLTLIAFGGAGPVHAAKVAEELEIEHIIVPPHPGLGSTMGTIVADFRRDYVRTIARQIEEVSADELMEAFLELREVALEDMYRDGVRREDVALDLFLDLRYIHQTATLTIPIKSDSYDKETILKRFYSEYERLFGFSVRDEQVEVSNIRLTATYITEKLKVKQLERAESPDPRPARYREAYFAELGGFVEVPIYVRDELRWGHMIKGPAIIEEGDSTTVIYPAHRATIDKYANIIISVKA